MRWLIALGLIFGMLGFGPASHLQDHGAHPDAMAHVAMSEAAEAGCCQIGFGCVWAAYLPAVGDAPKAAAAPVLDGCGMAQFIGLGAKPPDPPPPRLFV